LEIGNLGGNGNESTFNTEAGLPDTKRGRSSNLTNLKAESKKAKKNSTCAAVSD